MSNVIFLKRSYACEFCNPAWHPAPPPDTPRCTCYYPCEEWWCPEFRRLDDFFDDYRNTSDYEDDDL